MAGLANVTYPPIRSSEEQRSEAKMIHKEILFMSKNNGFAKNIELIGYHDLNGKPGFQMAMQEVDGKYYLYVAHFKSSGWTILEVTDPARPRFVKFVPGPDLAGQGTCKIQVADNLMITSLGGQLPMLQGTSWEDPYEEGVFIWDVKDPENPKWLSHWKTGVPRGMGVHRFYYSGGRYVHLSASCPGFSTMIYRILDIIDPCNPVEVGRWWVPEQWEAGRAQKTNREVDEHVLDSPMLHGPPYVKGNLVYCSYSGEGMIILDISDISLPKFVGQLRHHPPFAGGFGGARCHTILPLSRRPFAVMTSEGERYAVFSKEIVKKAQPMNFIGMVDVSDASSPTLISVFPYPEVPPGFPHKNFNAIDGFAGPFGPHNLHEPHGHPALEDRNDRVYNCYFHAGLRVYDISDPFVPKEIAYFIPPNPTKWAFNNAAGDLYPGPMIATTEDVIVDRRGNIFIDTFHDGIYALRCTV